MNKAELYKYAKDENIKVKKMNFEIDEWKGQCSYNTSKCIIYLNANLNNDIQEKCVLAHEIGHYKKGIICNDLLSTYYKNILTRSINDFRANKWAVNKLIPLEQFKRFIGTNISLYEASEIFGVTENFVKLAFYIYEPYLR